LEINEGIQMGELFERVRPVQPLECTGERFTTDATGQIEVEHLHRYFLARHLTRGLDVLDIASGEGYGSAFLAQIARSVIGVEIDRAAVEHARHSRLDSAQRPSSGCSAIICRIRATSTGEKVRFLKVNVFSMDDGTAHYFYERKRKIAIFIGAERLRVLLSLIAMVLGAKSEKRRLVCY
jgi:GNAT superfamily N-acetyltransferase